MPRQPDPMVALVENRLLPVRIVADARHTAPLADALMAGGLSCAEVTLRTDVAEAAALSDAVFATAGLSE